MRPRNVNFSLILVLAVFVFAVIKVRFWEPKKKLTLNRNPYHIKYSELAMCRMDCLHINASDVTEILKNGDLSMEKTDVKKMPCPVFNLQGRTKKGIDVWISVEQCGKLARIINCYIGADILACNCSDFESLPVSVIKNKN